MIIQMALLTCVLPVHFVWNKKKCAKATVFTNIHSVLVCDYFKFALNSVIRFSWSALFTIIKKFDTPYNIQHCSWKWYRWTYSIIRYRQIRIICCLFFFDLRILITPFVIFKLFFLNEQDIQRCNWLQFYFRMKWE